MCKFIAASIALMSTLTLLGCGGEDAPAETSQEEPKGSTNPAASMMQRKADEMTEEEAAR